MAGTNNFVPPVALSGVMGQVFQGLSRWLAGKLKARPEFHGTPIGNLLFQSGQVNVTFNAGMDGTLTFPRAFPTGTIAAIAMSANPGLLVVATNGFFANAINLRSNVASVTVAVNYIVVGY